MPIIRAQVSLAHTSGLPEDVTTNTFHFERTAVQDYTNIFDMLEDFYTATPTGGANSVQDFLSDLLQGEATVKLYELSDPEPRAPVFEDTFVHTTGTDTLPAEVALCASFHAPVESGQVQARRRGRVYIGPLADGADTPTTGRPSSAFQLTLARALRDLIAASDASVNNKFVVYSTVNDAAEEVTAGWVDNAFDTVRSRGPAPTSRTIVTDSTPA